MLQLDQGTDDSSFHAAILHKSKSKKENGKNSRLKGWLRPGVFGDGDVFPLKIHITIMFLY
jgi:hypothetical protein